MRQIKFRGMSLNGWVYGYYVVLPDGLGGLDECIWELGADNAIPVNSEIISQYTGLKDKNGTEIYEGDVLAYNKQEYVAGYPRETNPIERVSYGLGAFWVGSDLLIDAIDNDSENEIIGNVFENPELLEVQHE